LEDSVIGAAGAKCNSLEAAPQEREPFIPAERWKREIIRSSWNVLRQMDPDYAPTALRIYPPAHLGRCPRLLHFTPLAL